MSRDRAPGKDVLCDLTEGAAMGVFNVFVGERTEFWTPEPNSLTLPSARAAAEEAWAELSS